MLWSPGHNRIPMSRIIAGNDSIEVVRDCVTSLEQIFSGFFAHTPLLFRKQSWHKFCSHSVHAQILCQNDMGRVFADVQFVTDFPHCQTAIVHYEFINVVDDNFIATRQWPARSEVTLRRCSTFLEPVIPFFYLCDAHGFIKKSLLYFSNCFRLSFTQLLTKFDTVALF